MDYIILSNNKLCVGTEKGFFIIDTQIEESTCILDNSQLTGSTDSKIVRTIYEISRGVLCRYMALIYIVMILIVVVLYFMN
jgi:hypothetical protein